LSATQIVYLILVILSALIGAYSGYRWDSESQDGRLVAAISGHSWFTDAGLGCGALWPCRFGQVDRF